MTVVVLVRKKNPQKVDFSFKEVDGNYNLK